MELIIFIGLQASGKSSFHQSRFSSTHVHISKDRLPKSSDKNRRQLELLQRSLAAGKSVAVDNTNARKADRQVLIEAGRRFNARIIGYYFESVLKDCLERNKQRKEGHVPAVALYTTAKRLEAPGVDEGFHELYFVRLINGDYKIQKM